MAQFNIAMSTSFVHTISNHGLLEAMCELLLQLEMIHCSGLSHAQSGYSNRSKAI